MQNNSVWVHGTSAVASNAPGITLARFGTGADFQSSTPANLDILFPIASPVIINGKRARLIRVFLLYQISAGATLQKVVCMDGGLEAGTHPYAANGSGATFYCNVAGPAAFTGNVNFSDAEYSNVTRFDLSKPAILTFGLVIVASVQFNAGSTFAVFSAGADLES